MSDSTHLEVSSLGFVWYDDFTETAMLQYSCHMVSDIFLFLILVCMELVGAMDAFNLLLSLQESA